MPRNSHRGFFLPRTPRYLKGDRFSISYAASSSPRSPAPAKGKLVKRRNNEGIDDDARVTPGHLIVSPFHDYASRFTLIAHRPRDARTGPVLLCRVPLASHPVETYSSPFKVFAAAFRILKLCTPFLVIGRIDQVIYVIAVRVVFTSYPLLKFSKIF